MRVPRLLLAARHSLSRLLFAPAAPGPLGLCRVAFFGLVLVFYLPVDFAAFGGLPDSVRNPISAFKWFGVPIAPAPVLDAAQLAWRVALLLACLGLFTRPATWVVFLLGTYLLAVPQNAGRVFHDDAVLVFVSAALALSRCGDAWSADARRRRRRGQPAPRISGEYRWPLIAAQVVLCCVFFAAGYAKLKNGGLDWVFSDHLAAVLVKQRYNSDPWLDWGLAIAQRPWMYRTLAAGTLLVELLYPLALFSRRARWLLVPAVAGAQVGIRALMGPAFWPFLFCNVFWLPAMLPGRFGFSPRR